MAQVSRHEEREKYEKDGPAGRLADDGAPASESKKRIIAVEGLKVNEKRPPKSS